MDEERVQRRLTAILVADAVGYSRRMGEDEEGTLASLTAHRKELIEPCIAGHRGRVVKTTGDGLLAEFASVVDAVNCAVAFQEGMQDRNAVAPDDRRIDFRIGVNIGDVIVQDGDVFGNGDNIAARLEAIAEPGSIVVSGKVYDEVQDKVDLSFTDLGPQEVKNIARPVSAFTARLRTKADIGNSGPLPLPDKPSIAVLPFQNISGDPEQEYFSDGITEDVITLLSRIRWFFVIARNTTFTYKNHPVDVQALARNLGVRYVLEGSVRKAGERVRITAQLIDGSDGMHLWAERYDRDLKDIFEVQDEITQTVVGAIVPEMADAERDRARGKKPESLDAWDIFQRGREQYYKYTEAGFARAEEHYQRAIELDPNFAQAYAAFADLCHRQHLFGYSDSPGKTLELGLASSLKAVELDSSDAEAQAALDFGVQARSLKRYLPWRLPSN